MRRKMSPKAMKKAMKRMGVDIKEMDNVERVTITCSDKEIIIKNPQVTVVKSGGQDSFQITGKAEEKTLGQEEVEEELEEIEDVEIPIEDIKLVASQTSVSDEEAEEALKLAKGNLAQAILNLKNR
jgi:nascent polypeptide-associated complex subunit alpha